LSGLSWTLITGNGNLFVKKHPKLSDGGAGVCKTILRQSLHLFCTPISHFYTLSWAYLVSINQGKLFEKTKLDE
jgi:hypothetical protein